MSELLGVDEVNANLERLLAAGSLSREAYLEFGNILVSEMQENFRVGGRPTPWKTSGRVAVFGGNTLKLTSGLSRSLHAEANDNGVEVGTDSGHAKRAWMHMHGGTITAKGGGYLTFKVPASTKIASARGRRYSREEIQNERGDTLKKFQQWRWIRVKSVTIPQRDFRYISPRGWQFVTMAAIRRLQTALG